MCKTTPKIMKVESAEPTVDVGEGYRLVQENEMILPGDEYYSSFEDIWIETVAKKPHVRGEGPTSEYVTYRRRVDIEQLTTANVENNVENLDVFVMRDFLQHMHREFANTGPMTFFLHSYPVKFDYSSSDETADAHNRWHLEALRTFDLFNPDADVNWLATYDAYVDNNNVPPGWEKGVSNQITIGQKKYFIPMFDMKGTFYNSQEQLEKAFGPLFHLSGYPKLAQVFSTGNSYHVYVPVILTLDHWRELLIDTLATESAEFTVDKRWLGRVLETDGLTAMRISANTVSKRQVPYRVYPQV